MRAAWLGLLLLMPLAHAQAVTVEPAEVDTTLYFHVINIQDMPVNTQRPPHDPAFTDDAAYGPFANTLTCLHPATGPATAGLTSQEYHRYNGYSSPSFVEYGLANGNGNPRTWPERGLAYDLGVLGETATLHWFMEAGVGAQGTAVLQAPTASGVLANVVVDAIVQESFGLSVDDKAYGEGELLMQGRTLPITAAQGQVSGDGAGQVVASQVDGRWVYEFVVPLQVVKPVIDQRSGYTLQVTVRIDNPACDPEAGMVMTGSATVFSDPAHEPRLELRNAEPLRVTALDVNATDDGQALVTAFAISPWGNYDVDVRNATLVLAGPSEAVAVHNHTIQRYAAHDHHFEPTEIGWLIDVSSLADGRYEATYAVQNLQHTATATATTAFYVDGGRVVEQPAQESPTLAAWTTLGLLALAVAWARGRR